MKYEILDGVGNVVNTIVADKEFVEENYSGQYRQIIEDPVIPPPIKTEEEKLADAVAAAVAKLIADGVLKQA